MNLERIRAQIVIRFPWWAVLSNLLDWQIDNSVPTACTNGKWMKFNETWMDSMPEEQQLFIVLHELTHIALKHHLRRGNREHSRFNIAADHRINLGLLGTKGITMPADGYADLQYTGLTEYEIYELLADEQKPDESGDSDDNDDSQDDSDSDSEGSDNDSDESEEDGDDSDGSGDSDEPGAESVGMGDVVDGDEGLTEAEIRESEAQIDQAVQTAATLSELAGKDAGVLAEIARSARQPQVNWRKPLRRFLTSEYPTFRSYRRVDRRWLAAGVVWPGQEKQNQAELVFAVDCSASMPRATVAALSNEIEAAFNQVELATVHVLYFSDRVRIHKTYKRGQRFEPLERVPTGGTNFNNLFEYIDEHCPKAKATIVCTDGYDDFPEARKSVLWAMTTDVTPPFGDILKVS